MKVLTSRRFLARLTARRQHRRLAAAALLLTGSLSLGTARADTINGTGYNGIYSNGNWSDTRNWDSTAPSNGERNLFFGTAYVNGGGTFSTSNNDLTNYAGYRLNFENNASAPSFTLNGNALTLFSFGTGNDPAVINNSAKLQTINLGITFSGGNGAALVQTNTAGGSLLFGGAVAINTGTQLRISGAGGTTTTFNGVVSGGGTVVASQGTSAMTVVYGAANTYTGDTFIDSGTLQFGTAASATGSADSSALRLGATSGAASATIFLATTAGSQTLASVINPRAGNTGTLSLNAANTSGMDTLSGHIALDKAFTITEAAGTGTLAITQARANATDTLTGTDIKGFTLTLTPGAGGTIRISGDAYNSTGSGNITTTGAGAVTLSGNNTYSGTTTVSTTGVLNINSATALGTSTLVLQGGASIDNTSGAAIVLSNNNAVNLSGNGLTFSTSAGTALNNLDFGTGITTYSADRTITLNGGGALAFGNLVKTTNNANTLQVNNGAGTTANSSVTFRGYQLTAAADTTAEIQVVYGSGAIFITGPITQGGSTGTLRYSGTGSLTLSGNNNTYTGGLTVDAGQVSGVYGKVNINSATALGAGGLLTLSAGVFDNASGSALTTTTNNPTLLSGDIRYGTSVGTAANNLTISGPTVSIAADKTIFLNGAGALTFTGVLTNTGNSNRQLVVTNGTGTTSTSAVSFGGYQLTGTGSTAARVDNFNSTGNVNITGPVTDGVSAGSGILYNGTGTLTLSGNNTHTGLTSVSSGTLTLAGNNTGATGGVTITGGKLNVNTATALGAGGTFSITGGIIDNTSGAALTETTSNPVTQSGNYAFSTSTGTTANSLTINGAVTSTAANTITLNGAGALAFTGALINNVATAQNYVFTLGTGTAATTSITYGGLSLSTGSSITTSISGTAPVNITGAVTNGTGTNNSLTYAGTSALTLSGNNTLTGLTTLTNAVGILTLSGNNTAATGGVTLPAGKLNVNSATALGTGTFTISGGTLDNTSGSAVTETTNPAVSLAASFTFGTAAGTASNNLNVGTGAVTSTGSPTFTLNGADTLTFGGTLTNNNTGGQTLIVTNGAGTTAATALNLGGYALTGAATTAAQVNTISGTGNINIGAVTNGTKAGSGLTYNGTGTLGLTGASTYTGATLFNSGTVNLSGSTAGTSVTVSGATTVFNEPSTGVIAGTASTFAITGGTANLSGQNTYTGNTTLTAGGTINLGADSTSTSGTVTSGPVGTGILVLNGGTIAATGGAHTIANPLAPGVDNAAIIAGSQNLTFAGNLNLNTTAGGAHYTTLTVNNTGNTTFAGGINVNGLQLTFNGSGNVLVNSPITGNANFVAYAGSNTLTLTAANTYVGPTNVTSGTLLVNNTTGSGTGTGTVTVNGSGTLLGGTGAISGATTVNGPASITGATSGTVGTLTLSNNLTFTGTSGNFVTYVVDLSGATADKLAVSGTLGLSTIYDRLTLNILSAPTLQRYQLITYTGSLAGGTFNDTSSLPSGYSLDYSIPGEVDLVTPVPEPGTVVAGLLAFSTLGYSQRRRLWGLVKAKRTAQAA